MTGFRADLAGLDELVAGLAAFDERASTLLTRVDEAVRRTQADWSGWAADEYCEAHRRWTAGAARMREAVAHLRRDVHAAHDHYAAAADANVRMWS
jgi:WXG100 family type VII secretion target